MMRKSNSNKIYTIPLSLSLSRLSTLPTREQHSKFFYSYSYQIPLPTCKQLNHVIWNHQKDKTQTTKTILPPSNLGKNDKLTPRYFCTSSSFKDCLIYCLNIFQCYCPVKDKTLSKHHKTTEPQIFQTVLIISQTFYLHLNQKGNQDCNSQSRKAQEKQKDSNRALQVKENIFQKKNRCT